MKLPIMILLAMIVLNGISDYSIYCQIKNKRNLKWLKAIHIGLSAILHIWVATILLIAGNNESFATVRMWSLFAFFSIYLSKYIYAFFLLLSATPRLFKQRPSRWIVMLGICMAALLFTTMWWGALHTRKNAQITEIPISSSKLPSSFTGYKIVQFSDFHAGTFGNDTQTIESFVDEINRCNPDLIVFTGDIVNSCADELIPFISTLKKLKATDGVISILGNHDYGTYHKWSNPEEQERNLKTLMAYQTDSLGWHLLLNSHMKISRNGQSISIIGVENWGEPPFSQHGNLKASYPDLNDGQFKVLLSHNPTHWEAEVAGKTTIDLTLSGHTHAMQAMVTIAGKKYSPSSLRYSRWEGLHKMGDNLLYVNIGMGEVGIPMRIGAAPEISVFTLQHTEM